MHPINKVKKVENMLHVFSINNHHLAVDQNSGSVHILDEISYELLKHFPDFFSLYDAISLLTEKYPLDDIKEAYNEICLLQKEGLLYTSCNNQELFLNKSKETIEVKALCLNIAHSCNLNCEYCFASKGDYNSGTKLMSKETAFGAIDFLINNSGNRKDIEIDFFGGEPLLNFDVVKATVEYGRSLENISNKKIHFTITTNGTLLNEDIINFINQNMDNVVISIDGRKDIHDKIRYDNKGMGSYDQIINNALSLVKKRENKNYYIRGTFTANNTDFSRDVLHIFNLGFDEISIEPAIGKGQSFHITENHLQNILKEYEKLALICIEKEKEGRPIKFYHFNLNLYEGPCLQKRLTACGAGIEYFAVTPDGDLYPCHQFVGNEKFKMGHIISGVSNIDLLKKFTNTNIFTKSACKNCWAKLYCSGGCHANSFFSNGNIDTPDPLVCNMQKKRIECAIMIEAARI